ncbi:hypothetical protein ACHAP8_008096 [Fusarium lateritium]
MKDELTPLTAQGKDTFGGWAATLVDSLDTLWIMDLKEEFSEAAQAAATLDWGQPHEGAVNLFETTIRHLGGLLGAYELSHEKVLLQKAIELGEMLYVAFDTPNRLPGFWLNFEDARSGKQVAGVHDPSASPSSLVMEFTKLSMLTGDPKFYDATDRVTQFLVKVQNSTLLPGMWPLSLDFQNEQANDNTFSLGALADSLYEYLPKMHALLGGVDENYPTMYRTAMDVVVKHLLYRPMLPGQDDVLFSGDVRVHERIELSTESQHLTCFTGGMFALGGKLLGIEEHVNIGERLARGCGWAYKSFPTGMMPEIFNLLACPSLEPCVYDKERWSPPRDGIPPGFRHARDPRYLLRPEAIESVFIMYRITADPIWQDMAWDMFQSIIRFTTTPHGNAAIDDVVNVDTKQADSMESFWLSETLKYFYLIFSPPDLVSLDQQLTLLEERLEKAETVLRRHYTDSQIAEMLEDSKEGLLAQSKAQEPTPQISEPTPAPTVAQTPGLVSLPSTTPGTTDNLMQLPTPTTDPGFYLAGQANIANLTADPFLLAPIGELEASAGLWAGSQDAAFEFAPTTTDDFEWNEQETSWGTYDPASWSITNHVDGNPSQAIMDGMASLTIGDQKRGYYGAASGSALLRQILSARPDGEEVDNDVALHEIESLFQQHSDHSQWFRSQAMLTRVAVENLIDAFFVFYHPTFPIVHEPTFRAQYAGTLPCANKGHWNTLANILAALGSFASSNVADATDLPIFQAAQKSLFSNYLEVGNLTLVQAFSLSSNYMQKRNKPNTGFNYGGIAIRLAIGLGLHKDLEGNSLSPLQSETRRRIWWCLCVLDVGATITYGRPLNWPQAGVETAFPQNIHEKDLTHDSTHCPPEVDGITMYTYIRVQSAYHLSTMTVYNRLITSPFPSATELITLDDVCIGSWLAQVPYYYRTVPPPDSEYGLGMGISEWRYRNLRIVMYRPFLVRWARSSAQNTQQNLTSSENLAVFRCLDAAKESVMHIQSYWTSRTHSRLAAFYILYFLFHATLIPVHCLRQNPHHALAPDWRSQIQASLTVMGGMAELNPNSSKCRDITLKLCWPHLNEDGTRAYCENPTFMPNVAENEAASIISGYNTWCESMTNAGISVPTYEWADDNDSALGFF